MAAAGDLYEAATELLAACATALLDSPGGPIDYQVISQGLPAFDCAPALFVSVGGPAVGTTYPLQPPLEELQRIVTTGQVNIVTWQVTVLRCITVIEEEGQNVMLPDPAQLSEDARICYGDLWAIWNGVKNQHRLGTLFQRPSGRREFGIDPAAAVRTAGGFGGWIIQVRAELDGYA